jgi:integrase
MYFGTAFISITSYANKKFIPPQRGNISLAKKKMKKSKRTPWNKGRNVGPREPFSPSDVTRIKALLSKQSKAGLRDLALFSTAIDTMLNMPDLLGLAVKDVRKRNKIMRDTVELPAVSGGRDKVRCTLSKSTIKVLERWIKHADKKQNDYLFTGRMGEGMTALSARQVSRLVKTWAADIGLKVNSYGTYSLRRSRAMKDKSRR